MRRRRRRGLLTALATLDAIVLLTIGVMGGIALIFWPDNYVADLAVPIALMVLFVTLRWG
jgi:hypothetical protein